MAHCGLLWVARNWSGHGKRGGGAWESGIRASRAIFFPSWWDCRGCNWIGSCIVGRGNLRHSGRGGEAAMYTLCPRVAHQY